MQSFREFVAGADPSQIVTANSTTGHRSVDAVVVQYTGEFETRRTVSDLVVGVHLDPILLEVDMAGRNRKPHIYSAGHFDVSPPDSSYRALRDRSSKSLGVAVSKDVVSEILSEVSPGHRGDFGAVHQSPQTSELIVAVCQQIAVELAAGNPEGPLYTDSLVQVLVMELFRTSREKRNEVNADTEALSRTTVAQIEEYIDSCGMDKVDIRCLASIAAMPIAKFTRFFKQTTGQTPYQYLLQSRLQKAKVLVTNTTLPIAQIASDCGFSSQSHMTDLFRAKIGITPGRMRKR